MSATGHIASGRLVALSVLMAAGVLASPVLVHAEPATAPPPIAPQQPLTVPRPDMGDPGGARREANRERIRDARIERLHAGLQLNPDQERLWPPVASAIRGLAAARGPGFRQELEAVTNTNDALKMQGEHMAKAGAAMGQLADATKPLLASLTPEQKGKLPMLLERAPLRKVVARAFGSPLETATGQGATPSAPGMTPASPGTAAAPGKPAGQPGTTSPPPKDPDDDE